ncbi:MAG: YfcE family phosphodiesterase [Gemmatimonadaceae bacterium]|nr:YfcE family phosphodiesterase [Gemmatimonadaceae bacterium]
MRVGLIADSHDRVPAVAELVKQMQAAGATMMIHAGDYCSPFCLRPIEEASMSLAGVFGRNDGDTQGLVATATAGFGAELFESPHSFSVGGQRILVVHDIGDVQPRSIEAHTIVVHGCTHQQEMRSRGDTLIINPGEACGWLYGTPKGAIVDLDSKQVEFISLDPALWTS